MSPLKFFAGAHSRTQPSAQSQPPAEQAAPKRIARKSAPLPPPARKRPPSVCPYCHAFVEKLPEYRGICQRCGQTYYVRTRPGESWSSLLTARQVAAVEENRATQLQLASRQDAHEEERTSRFNWFWSYSSAEGQWRTLKRSATLHARDGNWLLYRNARYGMAELRRRQARLREALDLYLEVWYLDLNGPHDCWGVVEARRVYETAPFSPDQGLTTPAVSRWVNRVSVRLELERAQVERLFMDVALRAYRTLNLPLTPKEAWGAVAEEVVV